MPQRLPGIEALSFDLFETRIDGRIERMPRIDWGGRSVPSTAGVLHEHVARSHEIERDRFLEVLRATDRELRASYSDVDRELPTIVRFGEVLKRLGIGDATLAGELTELHMGFVREYSEVPPHHAALLARLNAKRPIALCSNFSHTPTALRLVEDFGLRPHLDVVVVSEAVGIRKPRAEIFEAVLEGLGVAPERVLHIGDKLKQDVAGAAAVGMRTAWVTRRVHDPEAELARHDGPPPDCRVADLGELEAVLGDR